MRASRSSRRPGGGFALAAAALLLPLAAAAQQVGPPIPLLPPSAAPGAAGPQHGPIAATQLSPPVPGWEGEMPPSAAALPRDLWRGTPRVIADLLLAHLPDTASPALQSLVRRLLLSPGAAPGGPDAPGQQLALLRAAALLRLGETDAARAVVAAMPAAERDRGVALAVDADAIAGNVERACRVVRERIRQEPSVVWQTRLIACQALSGKLDEARLGLQVLVEEKASRGQTLRLAIDALAGQPTPAGVPRLEYPEALTLRLLVAAHRRLGPGVIDSLPPDLALAVALDAAAPPAERLRVAFRAGRFGALSADRLRPLFAELGGKVEPGDGAALDAARRYAAIAGTGTAVQRLADMTGFAASFGKTGSGAFALGSQLVAPLLQQIEPDPSLGGAADEAAHLLLAADDPAAARRWSALVAGDAGARLQSVIRLAGGDLITPPPAGLTAPGAKLPLLLGLARALAQPVATADWLRLPAAAWTAGVPGTAPAAAWLDLVDAGRARRVAETVLAAVLVAAPSGTLSGDPIVLNAVVSGLMRVGLERDARRLAVEAALAAGI